MGSIGNGVHEDRPSNWVPVVEQPVFQPRKLRVVCVGAGEDILLPVIEPSVLTSLRLFRSYDRSSI
jgi:hypothetical protein